MKKKLIDYVKHYKLYLNENICDSTVEQLKNLNMDNWNDDPSSNELINISGNQELTISYSNEILTKEIIMKEIWNIINKYIVMFDGNKKGIPIVSVLGILNDNYEGGEFIMFEDEEIKFKKGDILVFPSIFLYPHKVEPVTKGTRYSFISWVW
jgi:hypothetical protein